MSWQQKLKRLERDYFDGTIGVREYGIGRMVILAKMEKNNETAQEGRSESSVNSIENEIWDDYQEDFKKKRGVEPARTLGDGSMVKAIASAMEKMEERLKVKSEKCTPSTYEQAQTEWINAKTALLKLQAERDKESAGNTIRQLSISNSAMIIVQKLAAAEIPDSALTAHLAALKRDAKKLIERSVSKCK